MKLAKLTLQIPKGARVGPDQEPIYGYTEVTAYTFPNTGLAVHKSLDRKPRWKWTITHTPSGLCLERIGANTKAEAVANMERALELPIDWNQPQEKVLAKLREDRRIMDGINEIATHG